MPNHKAIEQYIKKTVPDKTKYGYGNCQERANKAVQLASKYGYKAKRVYGPKGDQWHASVELEKDGKTYRILD